MLLDCISFWSSLGFSLGFSFDFPFGGYGLKNFSQNRVQWVSGVGQYIEAPLLDKAEKTVTTTWTPAIVAVYGDKDEGKLTVVSGADA